MKLSGTYLVYAILFLIVLDLIGAYGLAFIYKRFNEQ